jgi:hypothetical protein
VCQLADVRAIVKFFVFWTGLSDQFDFWLGTTSTSHQPCDNFGFFESYSVINRTLSLQALGSIPARMFGQNHATADTPIVIWG